MSRIEATKPIGYDKNDVQSNFSNKKKLEEIALSNALSGGGTPKVAFTLDVGNSIFTNGTQPSQPAVQA